VSREYAVEYVRYKQHSEETLSLELCKKYFSIKGARSPQQ